MIAERGKGFRAGCPLPASFLGCSALQQLVGFDTECLGQLPYDLQACVKGALLELAQIAPANLRFIGEIVLREPLLMAESAQVGGEHVSQIHARSGATCSKCAPRYIERNAWLCDYVLSAAPCDERCADLDDG